MSNPVFNNSAVFGEPKNRRGGAATQAAPAYGSPPAQGQGPAYGTPPQGAQWGAYGAQTADAAQLDAMYSAPSATTADTKRLTYDDVIMKTGGLLALLVVVGAASWYLTPQMPFLYLLGAIAGLVLGLVNAFKRNPSRPALIIAYTVAQGLFLGGISLAFGTMTVGNGGNLTDIVFQAVLATVATFAAALFLFRSGKVRVTPKFTRWLLIAMVGYLAFLATSTWSSCSSASSTAGACAAARSASSSGSSRSAWPPRRSSSTSTRSSVASRPASPPSSRGRPRSASWSR